MNLRKRLETAVDAHNDFMNEFLKRNKVTNRRYEDDGSIAFGIEALGDASVEKLTKATIVSYCNVIADVALGIGEYLETTKEISVEELIFTFGNLQDIIKSWDNNLKNFIEMEALKNPVRLIQEIQRARKFFEDQED